MQINNINAGLTPQPISTPKKKDESAPLPSESFQRSNGQGPTSYKSISSLLKAYDGDFEVGGIDKTRNYTVNSYCRGEDGSAFVCYGSQFTFGENQKSGYIAALEPNGDIQWERPVQDAFMMQVQVAPDGSPTILDGSRLISLNRDGSLRFDRKLEGFITRHLFDSTGNHYVINGFQGRPVKFDPSGNPQKLPDSFDGIKWSEVNQRGADEVYVKDGNRFCVFDLKTGTKKNDFVFHDRVKPQDGFSRNASMCPPDRDGNLTVMISESRIPAWASPNPFAGMPGAAPASGAAGTGPFSTPSQPPPAPPPLQPAGQPLPAANMPQPSGQPGGTGFPSLGGIGIPSLGGISMMAGLMGGMLGGFAPMMEGELSVEKLGADGKRLWSVDGLAPNTCMVPMEDGSVIMFDNNAISAMNIPPQANGQMSEAEIKKALNETEVTLKGISPRGKKNSNLAQIKGIIRGFMPDPGGDSFYVLHGSRSISQYSTKGELLAAGTLPSSEDSFLTPMKATGAGCVVLADIKKGEAIEFDLKTGQSRCLTDREHEHSGKALEKEVEMMDLSRLTIEENEGFVDIGGIKLNRNL